MFQWAVIVLVLAFAGVILNLFSGTRWELTLHDIILFLISLGMLFRIRFMAKKGEKEKLMAQVRNE